jgi:alkylation response protein AidB-like acyl-CoA dehydrogenase
MVTVSTLSHERVMSGASDASSELVDQVNRSGRAGDATMRSQLTSAYIRLELLKYVGRRVQTAISQGTEPGPEGSVLKLASTEHLGPTADLLLALEGQSGGPLDYWQPDLYGSQLSFLTQWATKIGGGTEEIQKNIVAERILGMPSEPRADKGIPFRSLLRDGAQQQGEIR